MFLTWRNHLITYMYSYKILRSVQINIEKNREEYSNEAERDTERGMRYLYTLTASKRHLFYDNPCVFLYVFIVFHE